VVGLCDIEINKKHLHVLYRIIRLYELSEQSSYWTCTGKCGIGRSGILWTKLIQNLIKGRWLK
jgi:hypothetical protein